MKKKFFIVSIVAVLMLVSAGVGAYAATKFTIIVNGSVADVDAKVINGTTYLPLRAMGELLGAEIGYNNETKTITVTTSDAAPADKSAVTIKQVSIKLDKVVQDADSLRLYVTYTNNSNEEVITGDSLAKIVADGKQYEYDSDFNFDRYYEKDVEKAPGSIEPGVTAQSVIFFEPIEGVKTINVVLSAGFEDYKFNNVPVQSE